LRRLLGRLRKHTERSIEMRQIGGGEKTLHLSMDLLELFGLGDKLLPQNTEIQSGK